MPSHRDRRATLRWAKSGPPFGVTPGGLLASSQRLHGATGPHCALLLPNRPPGAIRVIQNGRKVL